MNQQELKKGQNEKKKRIQVQDAVLCMQKGKNASIIVRRKFFASTWSAAIDIMAAQVDGRRLWALLLKLFLHHEGLLVENPSCPDILHLICFEVVHLLKFFNIVHSTSERLAAIHHRCDSSHHAARVGYVLPFPSTQHACAQKVPSYVDRTYRNNVMCSRSMRKLGGSYTIEDFDENLPSQRVDPPECSLSFYV
jgi:hypothetical protein